ncbi:gamma-glutamyl hydrolase-like isoform X2 [Hermetia illucens]|uniref:gamma-glutamyl hydrolase-like isoform X2 n=1 Tax=Hermetia illucens TaxID=343691 RepID=UPI0018CC35F1|nr:gamma-glutamyl hydrolase-like isoform X2 [Hermetia illucens]
MNIWIGKDRGYYKKMLQHINGVLLPGGAVFFHEENGFADAGKYIYEIATEMNKKGVYFPIFGICLGFELILYASAQKELRQDCDSVGNSLALDFQESALNSRLFGSAPKDIMSIFSTETNTFNYHKYCITKDDLKDSKIHEEWKILSTNSDAKVKNYISSVEHVKYPFYGVQFHPERNIYEHKSKHIIHSANAIKCSNYLAVFFVNEARKNGNHFEKGEEYRHSIHNFRFEIIDDKDIPWEQSYLFQKDDDYPQKKS